MQRRIRGELEAHASSESLRSDGAGDWLGVGLVAVAAATALVVWFTPLSPRTPGPSAADERLELTLASGLTVKADRAARLRVESWAPERVHLSMEEGRVAVRMPDEAGPSLELSARGGTVEARAASFTIALTAGRAEIDVGRGQVTVHRHGEDRRVDEGELWGWVSEDASEANVVPPSTEPSAAPSEAPQAVGRETPAPGRSVRTPFRAPLPSPVASPSLAPMDPAAAVEAAELAFDSGEVRQALELVRAASGAGELSASLSHRAVALECRSAILIGEYTLASAPCERALPGETDPFERRLAHVKLAGLYRARLDDCTRALPHLEAASVFGEASQVQDEILLAHADCSLRTGALSAAAQDLRRLEQRGASLAKRDLLRALQESLKTAEGSKRLEDDGSRSEVGSESSDQETARGPKQGDK